jgi:hypothetical protein
MRTFSNRTTLARIWLGLFCLTALLHHPCWSVPSAPLSPATLPCTDPSTPVTPDTHVAFPDENLERLALRLSPGLYADKTTYDRLVRDVKTIRDRDPKLNSVTYGFCQNVRVLRGSFKPLYFWPARTHLYGD